MPWSNTLKYIIDIYALLYSLPPTSLRIVAFLNYPFKVLGMKLLHKYTILLQPSFPFLKDSRFLKYSSMANRVQIKELKLNNWDFGKNDLINSTNIVLKMTNQNIKSKILTTG